MDVIGTKVLVAILFAITRFAFGVLPIKICAWLDINKSTQQEQNDGKREFLSCCVTLMQSFGGGVLFATCFLHMIPEVYYSIEKLEDLDLNYPYSQLVVSLGFFLIYFIEEISHWLVSLFTTNPYQKNNKSSSRTSSTATIVSRENKVVPETPAECEKNDFEEVVDEEVQTENVSDFDSKQVNVELTEIIEEEAKSKRQILRCVFIVLALSFHAAFEGLAIGLQNSVSNIWYLFVAVSLHSATILFCIGLEIHLGGAKLKTLLVHMAFLAISSPVGVIIGLAVTLNADVRTNANSFVIVFLEGISAGTILYITFFEVLCREKEMRVYRLRRAVCIWSGFGLMAALESLKTD